MLGLKAEANIVIAESKIQGSKRFTAGGTIQGDESIYITRQADQELYDLCLAGELGYVLTGRQMGKSSLMVRTTERLQAAGHFPAIIDLSEMGINTTQEEWHFGLLDYLDEWLPLQTDPYEWWNANAHLGCTKRLIDFITNVVLEEVEGNVILFFDEIDTTISLPFADDFFVAVRALHNNSYVSPSLKCLSIVLIGTATPDDLIKDPQRTPFNIGTRIDLNDFTFEEAKPLIEGFEAPPAVGTRILNSVMYWTGGHPYLTQKVCSTVTQKDLNHVNKNDVHHIVQTLFFSEESDDSCIAWLNRYLLERPDDERNPMLETYRTVLFPFIQVKINPQSADHQRLLLSGLVWSTNGYFKKRNRIFSHIFNWQRLNKELSLIKALRQVPPLIRKATVVLGITLVLTLGMLSIIFSSNYARLETLAEGLTAQLSGMEDELIRLEENLSDRDVELTSLRTSLESRDAEVEELFDLLESRETEKTNLRSSLGATNDELKSLETQLITKEADIVDLNIALKKAEKKLLILKRNNTEKLNQIDSLQVGFKE